MNNDKLVPGVDYVVEDNILIINEGVKFIPEGNFKSFWNIVGSNVDEIVLPKSLIAIGEYAFSSFGELKRVVIPDNVRYIMANAFSYNQIEELVIGKNVTYIGIHAFSSNKLKKVENNSEKLKVIDIMAFGDNYSLKEFDFNEGHNILVEEYAFRTSIASFDNGGLDYIVVFNKDEKFDKYSNDISSIGCCFETPDKYSYENGVLKINEGVEIVGSFSNLEDCTTVILPDSVVMIQYEAFKGLQNLKNIKFSENLLVICNNAFDGCSLREKPIKLPSTLCFHSISAFNNNKGKNKVLISNTCQIDNIDNYTDFKSIYEVYTNELTFKDLDKRYLINIEELLESDRTLLESFGLLPDTIKNNIKLNKTFNNKQVDVIKNALIEIIGSKEYDENKDISFVVKILEFKEIDINDIHEVVNYLIERKQIKTIYLLMSYGYDYMNNCMISKAIINGLSEMANILIVLGVNLNEIGDIKTTPLSTACILGNYNMVKHLIEKGAAINLVDPNNKRAIDYAIENNNSDIVDLINSYNNLEKSEAEIDMDEIKKLLNM